MPWTTPTLRATRQMVRDDVTAALRGAAMVANNALRVMSDAQGGLAHLILRYIDWLSKQLLPDTAETEWLDRHGNIWLVNSNGTIGRKAATYSEGTANFTGQQGFVIPIYTQLIAADITFQTSEEITIGAAATEGAIEALDAGSAGNLPPGANMSFVVAMSGIDTTITVIELVGGADEETDDQLRARVLERIQRPPMGGDADDFVQWTLAVPGTTRAWCAPREMGMGTVTVRFMCDALRASNNGFPLQQDIDAVTAYLNQVRPVAVRDFFVEAPLPEPINYTLHIINDNLSIRQQTEQSVAAMLFERASPAYSLSGILQPAQTIYAAWVSEAISRVISEFDLTMVDHPMPYNGALAVPGTVTYI
jgi:uncharacterized phage protein gp47/JayE